MFFSDFVQILHPIIGGASNQAAFVRTLFETIVTEEGQSTLDEQSEITYRSYFNGNTGISKIAKKVLPYIEPAYFVEYIEQFSDETTVSLCDSFSEHLPEINKLNVGTQLANMFSTILKEAASTKRKSASKDTQQRIYKEPHEIFSDRVLASGQVLSDTWKETVEQMAKGIRKTEQEEAVVVNNNAPSDDDDRAVNSAESKVQIIEKATVVNQYGENCVHIDHVDTFKL